MSIIQTIALKLLSPATRAEIARTTPLPQKAHLELALNSIVTKYTTDVPKAVILYAVSAEVGGKLIGNNSLSADKVARQEITKVLGEVQREDLNAIIALARQLA